MTEKTVSVYNIDEFDRRIQIGETETRQTSYRLPCFSFCVMF